MEQTQNRHKLIECKPGYAIVLPYSDNLPQDIPLFQKDKNGIIKRAKNYFLRQNKTGTVQTITK